MKIVAFIPVRGGSKSIPLKNIKTIAGKPLVYWSALAAQKCKYISEIYVSTDSGIIAETVNSFGFSKLKVIERSAATASDDASTESALLEFARNFNFDCVVLIQATSPMIGENDLAGGIELYKNENVDSVVSVVRQKRFIWNTLPEGNVQPMNYDYMKRPRRQEYEGYLVENGAFYITSKDRLITSQNRISGKIYAYEMNELSYNEIDEQSDWIVVESILRYKPKEKTNRSMKLSMNNIKMLITDCDGCMTDGGMYYTETGDEIKKFNTKDGMAFKILNSMGIITAIITGENLKLNERRAGKIGAREIIQSSADKCADIDMLCAKYSIRSDEIIYIGDDINDLEAFDKVGICCAPSDANNMIKSKADYITIAKGGEGVVREIVDLLIKGNGICVGDDL